jgi:hypothetical protein
MVLVEGDAKLGARGNVLDWIRFVCLHFSVYISCAVDCIYVPVCIIFIKSLPAIAKVNRLARPNGEIFLLLHISLFDSISKHCYIKNSSIRDDFLGFNLELSGC